MRLGSLAGKNQVWRVFSGLGFTILVSILLSSCGTAGGAPSSGSPPPPPVTVAISPARATIFLGDEQQMNASVTGTSNSAVTWSVNGVSGGNATTGTITASGLYTAPSVLPSSPGITITAASQAQPSASGTASITLESNVQVTVSPSGATVATGARQPFSAQVTGSGNPSLFVNWSLTGPSCASGCGTLAISANTAVYTAPATVPSPATVSIIATSVADPSKSATATVTITPSQTCSPAVAISPSTTSLALGAQQSFSASVCISANQSVTWTISGSGCNATNCGTVAPTGANTATYTAPASLPPSNPLTLVATSVADPSQSASASITITSSCSPAISISPSAGTVALGQEQAFTATVCFTTDQSVDWSVTGSGCSGTNCGTISSTGANTATYTAPASLPPSNPVTLVATSVADSSQSATATVTVVSGVSLTLAPLGADVATGQRTTLTPSVQGTSNTAVTWTVDGVANGNASVGEICVAGSNPCSPPSGPLSGTVEYMAPAAVPSPAGVYVVATSSADSSQSATAEMTIIGHLVLNVWPASSIVAPSGTVEFQAQVVGSENTGDSLTLQVFVLVSISPTNKIVIGPVPEPAVVGSTAVISREPATGWLGERVITSGGPSGGTATSGRLLDWVSSGFCAWMLKVPEEATSAGPMVTVH